MSVELSVIIVNFNTRELLGRCLRSIAGGAEGGRAEVIVVDNNSSDDSAGMIAREFPSVRTILNRHNARWAGGNNQGARIARGRYLFFLNSDTELLGDAIGALTDFLDRTPAAGIAGCRLLNTDGTLQRSTRGFPGLLNLFSEAFFLYLLFPRSGIFGSYHMTCFDHRSAREVDMVSGAAIAVRREVFESLGGFDEDFYFYGEETDFCYRARQAGYRTWFFPGAELVHHSGGSPQPRQQYYENLYSGLRSFMNKHHRGARLAAMIALQWTGTALRVCVYFLRGLLTLDGALIRKSVYYSKLLF